MEEKYFSFSDVLGYGWRTMKANLGFFIGVGLLWFVITYIPTVINLIADRTSSGTDLALLKIITMIMSWIISIIFGIGIKKIALDFCDEKKPSVGTLFAASDCFWRFFGTAILYGLIVMGGFILLIVPGIFWAVKYHLCFYFVVDKGIGPVAALKASGQTTMGVKWELFGFGIICGVINMLGLLCMVVGVFAAYPTVIVAYALVYRQLLAQTPQLEELGILPPLDQSATENSLNGSVPESPFNDLK
jgi:hypothetical protein